MITDKSYLFMSEEIQDKIDMESVSHLTHFPNVKFLDKETNFIEAFTKDSYIYVLVECVETSNLLKDFFLRKTLKCEFGETKFQAKIDSIRLNTLTLKVVKE